jgi:predicted dehydrogenase
MPTCGAQAVQHAMKFQSEKPKEAKDLRVMLEDKTIDAVSIATPNHWHALATIWACQAGKDVYCEKPASHNIFEGRKMVEAARKYNRIVQIGHQSRTNAHKIRAMELLREGVIGEVYMARGLCFKRRKPIGRNEATDIPAGVDYEMWLGPAEERAFKENRFHYNWHWYWDFGNGDIGNQGVHEMDIARWGLGKTDLPRFVYSSGGHFISNDDQQTPNTQQAIFDYDDSQIVFEVRGLLTGGEADMQPDLPRDNNTIGNTFLGSEGFMTVNAAGFHTYLGEKHEPGPSMKYQEDGQYATAPHVDNFLAAVKSRNHRDLTCDVLEGHLSAALCHLANTSYRVQRRLEFDPRTETFVGDSEADKYLSRRYRPGFEVPEKV